MSSPPTWLDLAARAEAGGDPELSDDVWRKLGYKHWTGDLWTREDLLFVVRRGDVALSVDAQKDIPANITEVANYAHQSKASATADDSTWWRSTAFTEPLARLAAKCRAMAAKEPHDAN